MAESKIPRKSIIRLDKSKNVSIGTSPVKVTFTYSLPSGYTLVCPTMYHTYGIEILGGMEDVGSSAAYGFFQRASGSALTVRFTFCALAIPTEWLHSVSIT